jgi:hypothetical protein
MSNPEARHSAAGCPRVYWSENKERILMGWKAMPMSMSQRKECVRSIHIHFQEQRYVHTSKVV